MDIPPNIPPHCGFEHTIELEAGAKPVITTPYRHPKKFKDEIKKTIQELLEKGWIRPNTRKDGCRLNETIPTNHSPKTNNPYKKL